jgi:hypothetical protein
MFKQESILSFHLAVFKFPFFTNYFTLYYLVIVDCRNIFTYNKITTIFNVSFDIACLQTFVLDGNKYKD